MELFSSIIDAIGRFLWGPVMCVVFISVGLLISIRTGFFQFVRFPLWWKQTIGAVFKDRSVTKTKDSKALTPFQALTTALSGTIGTGNIVGTATALIAGGPGALFWMWVSALFGMMTKFAEIALAVRFRYRSENGEWIGGPMVYLERGFGSRGLAVLFAVLCTLASFGLGCGTQANSIAGAFRETFGIDVRVTGILLALSSAAVILGGVRRIGKVTEKLVPFMTLAYVLGGLFLIVLHASTLPDVFRAVLSGAFNVRAAGGGVGGYVFAQAMRFGVSRGVFTNEAGLGSSAIAHASADTKEPVRQAMWGCFEVFTDTILMCTVTAFVILGSGLDLSAPYENGIALSIAAFATGFGRVSGIFLSIMVTLFAFSTICGWSHYGRLCSTYLFGRRAETPFKLIYIACAFLGSLVNADLIWKLGDVLNGLMAVPNLIGVVALSALVAEMTKDYLKKNRLR